MATEQVRGAALLDVFFDSGSHTPLFGPGPGGGAVLAAHGQVAGQGVYALCQTGKALQAGDTDTMVRTLRLAAKTGNPVVTFYDSPGAQLSGSGALAESLSPLKDARELVAAISEISGVVPQIAVVCGVCGASGALAALNSDLLIMAKDAQLFLTPPFLNEDPKGEKAAGTAAAAMAAGVCAYTAEDNQDAAATAARLVALLPGNNISPAPGFEYLPPGAVPDVKNYAGKDAVAAVADEGSLLWLFGDSGPNAHVALGTLQGNVVGFVATRGPDSFLCKKCTPKINRFVRFCDAYSIPLVTLLNTGGFKKSANGEEDGALREAGRLAATYADATTAKLLLVTGRAVGPVYTAFGSADLTVALEGSVISPLEPTAMVSILYKEEIEESGKSIEAETKARAVAFEAGPASAGAALAAGLTDMVCPAGELRSAAGAALDILLTKRTQRLPKKHGNMPI